MLGTRFFSLKNKWKVIHTHTQMFKRLANLCVSVEGMFSCHGTFQPCLRLNSHNSDRNQRNSALSPTPVCVCVRSLQGHRFICSNWFSSAIWQIRWTLLTISQPFVWELMPIWYRDQPFFRFSVCLCAHRMWLWENRTHSCIPLSP